ncbi:recombinase family protein [Chitinophaga barathri]|uniref:recombinase family protein n=1 Tax=Chitinophaga barathri TaxID=1647451 RepID=UPI001F4E095E|nr:recombinase family protein [Chitinophaga barathri]
MNTEQILKAVRLKGLKCSKNNFWVALRNPAYCGKIFIPKYKEEEAFYVPAQHEPLISEALFFEVQDVLDGRKKKQRTKKFSDENLPLRGFLICPKCGRKLTSSASKGRKLHYHYYHCISSCGCRYKADVANKALESEIKKYMPRREVRALFKEVIKRAVKQYGSSANVEKDRIKKQIELFSEKIKTARELMFSKEITPQEYRESKAEFEQELTRLEARLTNIPQNENSIDIDAALENAFQLGDRYQQEDVEQKRKIISSIFPENLVFDGELYRTTKLMK